METNYDWNDVKIFLETELSNHPAIATFGTIGSLNIHNDIDVLAAKNPEYKASEYFKSLHIVFDKLNNYLSTNYNHKIVRFACMSHEKEICRLADYKKGDLALHVMPYVSLPQMRNDWTNAFLEGDSLDTIIGQYYAPIKGFTSDFFSEKFNRLNFTDNFFNYFYMLDRFNSNVSEDLIEESYEHLAYYMKKRLKLEDFPKPSEKKSVRECYYELADIVEEIKK